jgi:hypothetical protein
MKPPLSILIGVPRASETIRLLDANTAMEGDGAGFEEAAKLWGAAKCQRRCNNPQSTG